MERVADALNRKRSAERRGSTISGSTISRIERKETHLKSLGITQIDWTSAPGQAQHRPADWRKGIHDDIATSGRSRFRIRS